VLLSDAVAGERMDADDWRSVRTPPTVQARARKFVMHWPSSHAWFAITDNGDVRLTAAKLHSWTGGYLALLSPNPRPRCLNDARARRDASRRRSIYNAGDELSRSGFRLACASCYVLMAARAPAISFFYCKAATRQVHPTDSSFVRDQGPVCAFCRESVGRKLPIRTGLLPLPGASEQT